MVSWKASSRGHIPNDRVVKLSETIEERAAYSAEVAAGNEHRELVLVAEDRGNVIGFVHALPSREPFASETTAEITAIFVRPEYWGKGASRRLLTETLESALT